MITTSRAALRLRAERRYQVAPLALPANADAQAIDTAPAVALFVERAEAVEWGFQLSNQTRNDVWAICARLDGLPLAIELAAARADQFTPADLLAHLARRLAVLHDGPRDWPGLNCALCVHCQIWPKPICASINTRRQWHTTPLH